MRQIVEMAIYAEAKFSAISVRLYFIIHFGIKPNYRNETKYILECFIK
jgi:hypothetical protein